MISFKKHLIGAVTLSAAALFALGQAPAVANAATQGPGNATANLSGNTATTVGPTVFFEVDSTTNASATANSTAEFTVKPGTLQLVAVPDLNFGAVPAAIIINGGKQALKDNTVHDTDVTSKKQTAYDGNAAGDLVVTDYRGTTSGWKLELGMTGIFDTIDSKPLSGITLGLKGPDGANPLDHSTPAYAYTGLAASAIGGTSGALEEIATVDSTHGIGTTTYKLNAASHATLTFPANTNSQISDKAYQTDLTWTLSVAP